MLSTDVKTVLTRCGHDQEERRKHSMPRLAPDHGQKQLQCRRPTACSQQERCSKTGTCGLRVSCGEPESVYNTLRKEQATYRTLA